MVINYNASPEAVFKEKHRVWELQLTITSHYLIVDSEVQLSAPTMTNVNECFPDYSKKKQPIGNERVRYEEGGGERKDGS
jgi:hypothetical protein